ncbi:MAG TPA: hypothetical protein VFT45_09910 [Longimicrobium sp.]|nr:hypothetical protein [Longimicrobium sp.]
MSARTFSALLILAAALASASAIVQRVGARRMVEGEAWCGTPAPCAVRALGAGFPFPYLIDDPQVSVPHQIGLVEDDFRAGAFLIDTLFWLALATSAVLVIHRVRGRRSALDSA